MQKKRLDILVEAAGLAESRTLAQKLIMAGEVRVNGNMIIKSSALFTEEDLITVTSGPRFVSRGGEKLLGAIEHFGLTDLTGKVCVDVGSSTGGFTDCMLQHGAAKVYAIDVGYGLLHWKLRNDPRVISMEKTNAREVTALPEPIDLVTIDASFISLKILLPVIQNWLRSADSCIVSLIKPQFEAGKEEAARGAGVIRDADVHRKVLRETLNFAVDSGLGVFDLIKSPLTGPKGNTEFLVLLKPAPHRFDIERAIRNCVG